MIYAMICYMEIICNDCGREFEAKRSDARYCSPKCRTAAHRQAHAPDRGPRKRPPLTDVSLRLAIDVQRLANRVQRLADDNRMPRHAETVAMQMRWAIGEMHVALADLEEALPDRRVVTDRAK